MLCLERCPLIKIILCTQYYLNAVFLTFYNIFLNGGMITDVVKYLYTAICELGVIRWTINKARKATRRFWPRIRRIASQNTSTIMIDCS